MVENYIQVSLDDEKAGKIAEIIGNKTCKKILNFLAEKEATETDISKELKIPLNTVDYNIKKLVDSGLIEQVSHFWSVRGKKMPCYRLANKKIIISPKSSSIKRMLPVIVLSGIAAVVVKAYTSTRMVFEEAANKAGDMLMLSAPQASEAAGNVATKAADITTAEPNLGLWFFGGAIFSLAVLLIINKIFKK